MTKKQEILFELIETVHKLRAPGGCPWDRKQTHHSLRPHLLEETYELLDVIDQVKSVDDLKKEEIKSHFKEELGDLLMQVLLHAEMTDEQKAFDFFDVAQELNDKLIRRHPHVFGDIKVDSADEAYKSWEKIKAEEKKKKKKGSHTSVLDGLPKNLPALQKANRVLEKVTRVGFQWEDMKGPISKVDEEVSELKKEVFDYEVRKEQGANDSELILLRQKIESELGDVFFTLCNIGLLTKTNPEDALRTTLSRFENRFRYIEKCLAEKGSSPQESTLEEMDHYWNEAKKHESNQ